MWKFIDAGMVKRSIDNHIIGSFCLIFTILGAIYPFPAWGSPYQTADHFWPFQNITGGLLDDVQGAAHTIVYNGGRIRKVSQLGTSLFLDGKDDWVDTGGFNADCVTDPTRCKDGFTLAFWLKVYGSGYIMSSGSFTNSQRGPGFRLLYDTKIQGFEFILETATKRWRVHVQADRNKWIHMIFSWKESIGIEYYEDGNLSTYSGPKPFFLSSRPKRYTPVITLGRPNKILEVRNFGYFEISQFAIWMKWLSSSDSAGVYLNGVVYDQETAVCCYFKSVGICTSNPCYDPKQCKRIDDTHRCLCPRVSLRLKTCKEKIKGYCADKLKSCNIYSRQSRYCQHRKMREICPRSCSYCAPGSKDIKNTQTSKGSTNVQGTSPESSGTGFVYSTDEGVHSATKPPFVSPTINPSSSSLAPYLMPSSAPTYGNMTRVMRRGKDCDSIQCLYHATCIKYKDYAECKCRESCTYEYAPVCGTNSKNYLNQCVLKQDSCMLGQWIRVAKKGSCGSRYPNAAHYWPFNGTSTRKILSDLRGKGKAMTYNGVKTTRAEQLGSVVSLDGIDDYVFINGIRSKCINDPTFCSRGLTVAFWIKYHAGEFILSGGRYTDADEGPGFRFICSNCASASPSASTADRQKSKRFVLNLSTQTQDWKISLDFLPKAWFQFAFTWHVDHGLKVYKNGKLLAKNNKPESVNYRPLQYQTIVIGRPNSLTKMHYYGKFDIGHLVVWPYELSAYEVEVAFLTVLAKTTKSLICCHFKKADPCLVNPCYNGASCRSVDEKFECICPDISQGPCDNEKPSTKCMDRSDDCAMYASQENYCQTHKKFMSSMCAKTCKFCGDENRETLPTIMTALQTPTAVSPRPKTPTSKPISTPRLSDATSSHLSPTKKTNGLTDSSSSTRKRSKGIINILGTESWTMDTNRVGKFSNTGQIDPENTQSGQIPIKTVLHSSIGTTSTKPSESMRMSLLYSKNEKTPWHNERTISKPVTSAPEVLPSPEPSQSVKTMALSPTPNIGIGSKNDGNKPSISSPFTGSVDMARETASPSYIDPHVLSTSGTAPTTQHPKGPRTPTYRIQTLSPTPTPYPTVAQPHRCPLGKGSKQECICMNCEGNTGPGLMCCIDQLYPNDMDQGITLVIDSLSMMNFLPKIASLRKLAGEIINEECSKTPCFQDSVVRKKRSASDGNYGTPIKSWDGSPITPTNTLKPNSKRNAASTAPRVQKPINVNVVMFKIARHPSEQRNLYTAFYVSVDGTNETQILKADVLEKIIRSKKGRLERGLNISINRVAQWHTFSRKFSIGRRTVSSTAAFPSSSIILPGGGTPSIEGQEGRNSTANMSKSTFIIVLVLGIGGFVVLAIIIIYMLVKFLRRMKGEFVPDKAYPNDQKSEAGSDQLIPSFIDPSTPRITDVPKKTVRPTGTANSVGGSGGGGGGTGGGGSSGSKKAKKPMGVKVTYKPPKWD